MKFLFIEEKNHIVSITLNRPEALNAFHTPFILEFLDAFSQIGKNTDVRCVIIKSILATAFTAGGDIKEEAALEGKNIKLFSKRGQACVLAVEQCRVPVILAAHGYTLGAGLELLLGCDITVVSEDVKIGIPTITLGEIPGWGGIYRLREAIGRSNALNLLLTGKNISAKEAFRIGLVQYVVPKEALVAKAEEIAKKIASFAPLAVESMKMAINGSDRYQKNIALDMESDLFEAVCKTEDRKEAIEAFIQKRSANAFYRK